MEIDAKAFEEGLALGGRRATEHFRLGANRDHARLLYGVLIEWPEEATSRFVSLVTEIWVIADVARTFNQEPELTREELVNFIETMYSFMNSFKHR